MLKGQRSRCAEVRAKGQTAEGAVRDDALFCLPLIHQLEPEAELTQPQFPLLFSSFGLSSFLCVLGIERCWISHEVGGGRGEDWCCLVSKSKSQKRGETNPEQKRLFISSQIAENARRLRNTEGVLSVTTAAAAAARLPALLDGVAVVLDLGEVFVADLLDVDGLDVVGHREVPRHLQREVGSSLSSSVWISFWSRDTVEDTHTQLGRSESRRRGGARTSSARKRQRKSCPVTKIYDTVKTGFQSHWDPPSRHHFLHARTSSGRSVGAGYWLQPQGRLNSTSKVVGLDGFLADPGDSRTWTLLDPPPRQKDPRPP